MERVSRLKVLYRSYRREVRFFFFLTLFFVVGQALFYFINPTTSPTSLQKLIAKVCSQTINTITPAEKTVAEGRIIRAGEFRIKIVTGCEGREGMILLAAAILASPAGILRRVIGSLVGCVVIYLFNIIRIVILYYLLKYEPAVFNISHVYIGQVFGILIAFVFFFSWLTKFSGIDEKSGQKV